jgi:hypothetical protein
MSTNENSKPATVTPLSSVSALKRRLEACDFSEQYVEVIRALVATRSERAVRILAGLLDSTGPIAEESIAGLVKLAREQGFDVGPAMRLCARSDDYEKIRHAHRVMAELGDEASRAWLRADDAERIEAYFDRKGFFDEDERRDVKALAGVANDDGEEDESIA